jgi:hypothetical protein
MSSPPKGGVTVHRKSPGIMRRYVSILRLLLEHRSWAMRPKQDHLVCFLGGSLLLGVSSAYPNHHPVWSRMSPSQQIDYLAGTSLIDTCVETYEGTETGLGAEIVMFMSPEQSQTWEDPKDWYIKRGVYVGGVQVMLVGSALY